MARIGGRSAWLAWPAGLLCAAVVAALLVLAAPGVPRAVSFIGDTLRAATTAAGAHAMASPSPDDDLPASDCRSLYTQPMWATLVWSPNALLSQVRTAPLSTPEAVAAGAPSVVVTCHWRGMAGAFISTTVSTLGADASSAVQAALSAQGFACRVDAETTHCERTTGDTREVHDLRGDRWVSSTLAGWTPDGYAEVVASRAFGR
jgi:hypothetical protein